MLQIGRDEEQSYAEASIERLWWEGETKQIKSERKKEID